VAGNGLYGTVLFDKNLRRAVSGKNGKKHPLPDTRVDVKGGLVEGDRIGRLC